ncbi:MAG: O-antigen ligase family protein [Microgenomates group bacterium]
MNIRRLPQLLLYSTLFLFRIPNLYILPFIHNSFLTTQGIGRIILLLFVISALYFRKYKVNSSLNVENILVILLLLVQTASIVVAINIPAFLMRYKDIVIAVMLFFAVKTIKIDIRMVVKIIVMTAIINSLYAVVVIYFPAIHPLFKAVTYERYFNLVLSDIERGRYYATSYDEVILPLLLSEGRLFLAALISAITLIGNFRTKILSLFFVFFSYLLLIKDERIKKHMMKIVLGVIIVGALAAIFSISRESYLERFNIGDNEQIETITSRADQIAVGLNLGRMPLGVGLGNYYDYLPTQDKKNILTSKNEQIRMREVHDSIHNNFASVLAESGYLALFIYTALILNFLRQDILALLQKEGRKKIFILMFWGIFIYGFLNPGVALSYQFQYWFYRGLISNENIN